LLDGGTPATDQIAALTKFITLQAGKPNTVDCAIAKPLSMSPVSDEDIFIGAPQGTAAAATDMAVHNCVESAATFHIMPTFSSL
jgi:hypothetical protein